MCLCVTNIKSSEKMEKCMDVPNHAEVQFAQRGIIYWIERERERNPFLFTLVVHYFRDVNAMEIAHLI